MLALTDATALASAIVGVFVLLALVTLLRIVLRREDRWTRLRIGVFVERDLDGEDDDDGA